MRAIVQKAYGGPEVLVLEERPIPDAGEGEVVVEVRSAAVDPGVWHLMTGTPFPIRMAMRLGRGRVLGLDVAGVIHAIGEGVTDLAVGDEVYGTAEGASDGSLAEYARARADRLAAKPASLSFEEAAAIPVSATTALRALRDAAQLQAGQRVLVLGAGGGVGHFAVQLAKALGARVTGVCSTSKVELVRSLGADQVIDYTAGAAFPEAGYDVIVDTAGHRPLRVLRRALTRSGTLVLVGSEVEGAPLGGLGRSIRAALLSPWSKQKLVMLVSADDREALLDLSEFVAAGQLRPVIDRRFGLEDAAAAIEHIGRAQGRGKTVITV